MSLSQRSVKHLDECHPDLKRLFEEVNKHFPCEIIEGHRTKEEQDNYFIMKKSKVQWPKSKHNKTPSMACDACPLPINWDDIDKFYFFAGFVLGTAKQLGIKIRAGADWDSDNDVKDESFRDLVHFELVD